MFFAASVFVALAALFGLGVISFDILLFLFFIAILGMLIYHDRKKVKLQGVVLIRRTEKGRDTIDRIAKSHGGFWRFLSMAGVAVSIPALLMISAFIINSSYLLITRQATEGAARLLLPAPVASPATAPGVLLLPWWIWVIGVTVVVIPHELFHGIMCRLEKIRIKSVGWILLLFIPGAFVEPDEAQLNKAKRLAKLKVYAAGSFANMLVAGLILVALVSVSGIFTPIGASFLLVKDGPAHNANMTGSIAEIDGMKILGADDIKWVLGNKNPGDIAEIKSVANKDVAPVFKGVMPTFGLIADAVEAKTYKITLGEHPETKKAYLGVDAASFVPAFAFPVQFIAAYTLLFWIFVFSLGIGLVNLLPIKPLDGGLFFEELIKPLTKKTGIIVKAVSAVMLLLLIFNLVGPWIV